MIVSVTVKGMPELLRELQRLGRAAQGRVARNMAMGGARVIARHAQERAPIGATGRLRASIKARRGKLQVGPGQAIAFANAAVFYSRFVEYGTSKMPARSFLRAALDSNQPEIRSKMVEIGGIGLQREVKRQSVSEDPGES